MSVIHRVKVEGESGSVECGAVFDVQGALRGVELEGGTGVPDTPCKLSWDNFCELVDGLVEIKALWKRKHVDPQAAMNSLLSGQAGYTRDTRAE